MKKTGAIALIRREDPEYDPIPAACGRAGVDVKTFNLAESRVYFDGYFGPISTEDWQEESPGRPAMSVSEARDIVCSVAAEVEDYRTTTMRECDDDECKDCIDGVCHEVEDYCIEARDIVADRFDYFAEIYGASPLHY